MEQKLSIIVVEDELADIEAFRNCFGEYDDLLLIDTTNSAEHAVQLCAEYLPDIVILDLELTKGVGSGLDFLAALNAHNDFHRPFVIITTNNTSPIIQDQARAFGADYIIAKYQTGYDATYVINFILQCKPTILAAQSKQMTKANVTIETKEQQSERIQNRLFVEFNRLGIGIKLKGRKYLAKGIELYLRNPQKKLSDMIAKEYGVTTESVDRAMQSAINSTWNTMHPDDLQKYYTAPIRSDRGTPTVLELISYYAQKIQKES